MFMSGVGGILWVEALCGFESGCVELHLSVPAAARTVQTAVPVASFFVPSLWPLRADV